MKRSILTLLAGVVLATSAIADIEVVEMSQDQLGSVHGVRIFNVIMEKDYATLVKKVTAIQNDKSHTHDFIYFLASKGGNLETALKIGRFLRKNKAVAIVDNDGCHSACVFVLAGAISRTGTIGNVGIHRPYELNDTTISADEQKAKYNKLGVMVRAYLSEMNVSPQLYNDMLYTAPFDTRILSKSELQNYGLVAWDPYEHAAKMAKIAKKHGISIQELTERTARIRAECPSIKFFGVTSSETLDMFNKKQRCQNDILNGLR